MSKKPVKKITKTRQIVPPCGLCGNSRKKRFQTECCGNWICGNESDYELFSYSRDICSRNHRKYTLCGYHHTEEHAGDWKTCKKCLEGFAHNLEMYVWYGTNKYNFEKLENPPKFEPTYCGKCKKLIILSEGGYMSFLGTYRCEDCPITDKEQEQMIREHKKEENKK